MQPMAAVMKTKPMAKQITNPTGKGYESSTRLPAISPALPPRPPRNCEVPRKRARTEG